MGLPGFHFTILQLFMSLNACLDIKWAYLVSFLIFAIIHVPNACLDIKWAYLVFFSYFWYYSCLLMHAWILNGLTFFSFHNFAIIHVP